MAWKAGETVDRTPLHPMKSDGTGYKLVQDLGSGLWLGYQIIDDRDDEGPAVILSEAAGRARVRGA